MQLAHVRDLFEDVHKLLIQEQYLFLEEFVLAGRWHLANPSQEDVDVARCTRLYEISEE